MPDPRRPRPRRSERPSSGCARPGPYPAGSGCGRRIPARAWGSSAPSRLWGPVDPVAAIPRPCVTAPDPVRPCDGRKRRERRKCQSCSLLLHMQNIKKGAYNAPLVVSSTAPAVGRKRFRMPGRIIAAGSMAVAVCKPVWRQPRNFRFPALQKSTVAGKRKGVNVDAAGQTHLKNL